jgi:hypothetical protein
LNIRHVLPVTMVAVLWAVSGSAQERTLVGRSAIVEREATARFGSEPARRIAVADQIYFAEEISTQAEARTVLEFRDGSTLELGPNSVVSIDRFVFNPVESRSEKAISVTQGIFRYTSSFVSRSNQTGIKTPVGTMGIRGSVVVGAVAAGQPGFLAMPSGNATFTATGGAQAQLGPGQSLAVAPGGNAPPVTNLPPAVFAQAMQIIAAVIGAVPPALPPPTPTQIAAIARANLVSAAVQGNAQPTPNPAGALVVPLNAPAGIPLLVQANAVGLLNQAPGSAPTPQQTAFIAQANQQVPNATQVIQNFTAANQARNAAVQQSGTQQVIGGVGQVAPLDALLQMVGNAIAANPALAGVITQVAVEQQPAAAGQIVRVAVTAAPQQREAIQRGALAGAPGQGQQIQQGIQGGGPPPPPPQNQGPSGSPT